MEGGADVTEEASCRAKYLIDGRRVTVSDLLAAGLISAGTELRFERSRIGVSYNATVTAQGRIRLDHGGEEFRSPSRAASVAAGARAIDGWRAWKEVGQGRLLDALRQELLEGTAADAKHKSIHQRLREAREHADHGEPERVSVRELLLLWGIGQRGDQVGQIEADLANHGLTTSPSFRAVTLDTVVSLITPPEEVVEETSGIEGVRVVDDEEDDVDLEIHFTVGNLSPLIGVGFVNPNESLDAAITSLTLNNYSQLAVLSGARNLRGAVTWRSIVNAFHRKAEPNLTDAIDADVESVPYYRDLFDVLPELQRKEFVFVWDETKAVKGIVTTSDVVRFFGEVSAPILQVGELDRTLRWILRTAFDIETVAQVCGRDITSFERLTMGDYKRVMENKAMWERLQWRLDRATVIARLDEIRDLRNKLLHFHSDPVPADAAAKFRNFTTMLRQHRGRG
ncbi:hypothetical protein FHU35_11480 [Saccharopolyspora dendranthemae]|uniref:RAMA domain-containing protein n=1 Tax=Saccharopolyspora dendranthemae TaxID=1181886 RepID=A0A561V8C0_9PSEU|nr:hypothetical protein FHU35_11480 [Saccharopolyspora dendranthemae]